MHNYHSAIGTFPPGGITNGPCCTTMSGPNWAIFLLPYIEQDNLFQQYKVNLPNEDAANAAVVATSIKTYNCPSDPNIGQLLVPDSGPGNTLGRKYATSSYRAVAGTTDGTNWFDAECGRATPTSLRGVLHSMSDATYPTPFPKGYTAPPYGKESLASISDGTSNTLMVGEYTTRTQPGRTTFWAYTYTSFAMSEIVLPPQSRQFLNDYIACTNITIPGFTNGINPCKRGWASFHAGVNNWLLADGSVHAISVNADVLTLGHMASIADGTVVVEPF
jgi:hypothetical protein